jgi:RNA ligase
MLNILEKYHKDGLLHKQIHPKYDLTIWNYSPRVQYEKLWDDITIQCRGLVTNSKGDIIARPFKKFFNYEEHNLEDIPNEDYIVYEKMDGSLGILFYYERELTIKERFDYYYKNGDSEGIREGSLDRPTFKPDDEAHKWYDEKSVPRKDGEWILATRGSFTSPQAIKGKEILDRHDISSWRKDNTYLFEIIYPENRIVVDYKGEEKLVVIGAFHTESGMEIPDSSLFWTQDSGFEVVTTYKTWGEGYDLLKEEISKEKEGYVIRFKNGFRMKIKGEEYKRLHKILTNISNRDIFEYVKENKPLDEILDKVPDEFYNWVKETKEHFEQQFKTIDRDYTRTYKTIIGINGITDKKAFANYALSYKHSAILFAMYDNKKYDHIIWKLLYPTYSKPFKNAD